MYVHTMKIMRTGEGYCSMVLELAIVLSLFMVCAHATGNTTPPSPVPVTLPPEDLVRHFYKKHNTCANVEAFVRHQVSLFYEKDKRITAKFLRLIYSDCMPNGCDGSILLDGAKSEKTAAQNAGLDGFVYIDKIKTVLEDRCPRAAGGPSYPVLTGRRDGRDSKAEWVDLPSPSISWESALAYFTSKGLTALDLGTLLGAHTMGRTHCYNIMDRLYNYNNTGKPDPSMKKSMLKQLRKQCPSNGQSNYVLLNPKNPDYRFSNSYYQNVLQHQAVLGVDQQLLFGGDTIQVVQELAGSIQKFKQMFAFTVSRMGGLGVLTGDKGEIRLNCRVPNK
ncbi:hem peroxidase [Dillenia turbinata]|uniref:Peroxidase n=1 Tax=Dillenia turbinata TaxID=194707 RepID=A0AAN8ZA94_9MAGN